MSKPLSVPKTPKKTTTVRGRVLQKKESAALASLVEQWAGEAGDEGFPLEKLFDEAARMYEKRTGSGKRFNEASGLKWLTVEFLKDHPELGWLLTGPTSAADVLYSEDETDELEDKTAWLRDAATGEAPASAPAGEEEVDELESDEEVDQVGKLLGSLVRCSLRRDSSWADGLCSQKLLGGSTSSAPAGPKLSKSTAGRVSTDSSLTSVSTARRHTLRILISRADTDRRRRLVDRLGSLVEEPEAALGGERGRAKEARLACRGGGEGPRSRGGEEGRAKIGARGEGSPPGPSRR